MSPMSPFSNFFSKMAAVGLERNHRNLMRYSQDEFGRSWPQPFYSLQEIMTRRAPKKKPGSWFQNLESMTIWLLV